MTIVIDETKLIQVTDLVGLRLTDIIRKTLLWSGLLQRQHKYAGYYETPGELFRYMIRYNKA